MLQLKEGESFNLKGYTVILPSICVGNAAQLACDLLISSKKLNRIGSLNHKALIPVFGPNAYQHLPDDKINACEIYEDKEDKLCVIQFRSPLVSRHSKEFNKDLVELVKDAKRVIVLSASFGFEKHTIEESPYSYCASENFKADHKEEFENIIWKEYQGDLIFGGGNAMLLYKAFDQEKIPVMLLFRYILEGDNSADAANLIREINNLCSNFLQLTKNGDSIKLTIPVSWNLIFGNDVIEALF